MNTPVSMTPTRHYQQCVKCVLDTNDSKFISFDQQGVCSYCRGYDEIAAQYIFKGEAAEKEIKRIVADIKAKGANKKYDCIIGLSGGVDSSYVALMAKEYGLRPLAVHFDNGWNSELAVKNIENIVSKLGIDLYTYVINWEEFRDLQVSYLKASVIDIEAITDHAIVGVLYKLSRKYGIKYIISGSNVATEGILPKDWYYSKEDSANIKGIHDRFGKIPLKTYPLFGKWNSLYNRKIVGIHVFNILDYLPYIKKDVKNRLMKELEWKDYGGKHYESLFTKFYQGYILPEKFKVDKRKAHLATLICSGQMTKAEALEELKQPVYDPAQIKNDKEFVLKKLGLTDQEFEAIMHAPIKDHRDYPYQVPVSEQYPTLVKWIRKIFKNK